MKYFNFKFLIFFFALAMAIPPAWAEETLIVCDGTTTNAYVPYCSEYALSSATNMTSQMIYLPSNLSGLPTGATIKSITFYGSVNIPSKIYNRRFVVRMGETTLTAVTEATLNNRSLIDNQVFGGDYGATPEYSGTAMTFTFDNGYVWNGGNLAIELYCSSTNNSSDQSYYWYGISAPAASSGFHRVRNNSNNNYLQAFLPKMTITYEGGSTTPEIGVDPESLMITDATTGTLNVTGTNISGNITAGFTGGTDDWSFTNNPLAAAGGSLDVNYTGRFLAATNNVELSATEATSVNVPVTYQPNLYVVGDYSDGNGWNFSTGTPMTYNNGSYTADITTTNNTFLLISKKVGDGAGWSNEQHLYGPVANGGNETNWELQEGYLGGTHNLDLTNGVHHCIYIPESMAGIYTITVTPPYGISFTRKMEQVATPTFTPAEGTFTEAQQVTITCATDGATIYYTTDGSTPTTSSTEYTGAITVNETTTIKAIAVKSGMADSEVATATYTKVEPSSDVNVCDGSDTNAYVPFYGYYHDVAGTKIQVIYPADKLADLDGKTITGVTFYTDASGVQFKNGSITVTMGLTDDTQFSDYDEIKTISGTTVTTSYAPVQGNTEVSLTFEPGLEYVTGKNLIIQTEVVTKGTYGATNFLGENQTYLSASNNKVYSESYVKFLPKATFAVEGGMETVATPTFSPAAGTYNSVQQVSISCETEGANISYSTDGGTTWTPYTGAITVSETTTIMAKASKSGMITSEASAEYIIDIPVDYAVTISPDGGTINFGNANPEESESITRTITITNTGLQPVTPTLSGLEAPFSTDYTPTQLAAGESVTITITFTPTEEGSFTSQATLSFGNGIADRDFTLTGKGGKYDENEQKYNVDYTWIDANGTQHPSNLLETAYEPEHIIAMLREIYTNTEIPGNLYRGYDANGVLEKDKNGNNWQVTYPAIGKVSQTETSGSFSYGYNDAYGWNIGTNKPIQSQTLGSQEFRFFDSYEYQPKEDGLTIIMMEMNDNPEGADQIESNFSSFSTSDYASLRDMIGVLFKSARIITTYKQTGNDEDKNAGTLFKIDANKLNRFFFLAKGRLRASDNSPKNPGDDWAANGDPTLYWNTSGSGSGERNAKFSDEFNMAPFYNMFEQFSPVNLSEGNAASDIYQQMINMQSYPVEHDCQSIPFIKLTYPITIDGVDYDYGHEFNMYGKDSQSDDCQDVRDMMFFVPKYRMMQHYKADYATVSARDAGRADMFVNYHQNDSGAIEKYAPTLGLYVIHQNEITGEKQADANVYDLNLSWKSNLLDFLPGSDAQYELFRVYIDEDGNKHYEKVATLDPNVTTYVDHVPMEATGQEVTYVVQGQDDSQFLSLQMSNEESFIIPGTDETLLLTLKLANDYSRFDPKEERNYYSNELVVTNNMSPYVSADDLSANGAEFTVYRYSGEGDDEVKTLIATLTPVTGQMKLNITWANQRGNGTDSQNYYSWINMPNKDAVAYSLNNNAVAFDNFRLFDNFYESVANNDHPTQYRYQVEFKYGDNIAHSNKVSVYIHKTDMDVQGYTQQNIDDDTNHKLKANVRYVDELVKYSSKQEILRYDAFRWKEGSENERKIMTNSTIDATTLTVTDTEVAPTGEADNGGTEYTLKMDGNTQGYVDIDMDGNATATFEDQIVNQEAGMYYFAPVVETFTGRSDYNTYGAPVQQTGVATIKATVADAIMSSTSEGGSNWTENGKVYTHYTVTLNLSELLIPENQQDALKDYNLYKVRVWRQIDTDLLNEEVYTASNKLGYNRAERISGDFMMEEVNNDANPEAALSREGVDNATGTSAYTLGSRDDLETFYSNWTQSGTDEVMGTFGAQKLAEENGEAGCITSLPIHFIVRAYYTRTSNLAQTSNSRGIDTAADHKYYIAEYEFDYTLDKDNIVTGLSNVIAERYVTSVTYYNMMGQQSSKPFQGVNIVVKRYSDGSTSTAKVLK